MPLGVLNNISAIYAENDLNQTQASLQNTLTQLSSGSRINSGADDPAGLAIADGLAANSAALTQSSSNASEGVGFLQVADGALSQVTSLLDSAVTLATEAGGGTLSSSQMSAANQEYQDILTQIGTIGNTTEYNGIQVFSSDQAMTPLTWTEGTGTAASSATATGASTLAASAITAGGTTAAANNAVSGGTYNTTGETALTWTPQSTNGTSNNVLVSGPIQANQTLEGTLTFTPTGGSAVSVTLGSSLGTGDNMSSLATNLQTALNATNSGYYSVSVVNGSAGNELQIALAGSNPGTALVAPSSSGDVASQTAYTLTVADGDSLSGTLTLSPQTTTAAGTPADVAISGSGGATATAAITSGNMLSGTLSVGGDITASTATPLSWTSSGSGTSETFSAAINLNDTLTGSFKITGTGDSSSPYTISMSSLAGKTAAQVESTIEGDIGANAADYSVTYSNGQLTIGVASGNPGSLTALSVANTSGSAASQAIPTGDIGPTTINLAGVSTDNLADTVQNALGSDYAVTYSSGNLSIALASGLTGTVTATSGTGASTFTQTTPAQVTNGTGVSVTLDDTNTVNLAKTVQAALGSNYTVTYAASAGVGTLTVTPLSSTTTGIAASGTITQTAANQASIAVTDGDTVGGQFTISQTIGGTAQSAVTVNLTGATVDGVAGGGTSTEFGGTSPAGQALIDAVNTALGGNAQYYNVGYSVNSNTGIGTLSIAVNSVGAANNVSSVSIANGTSTNALYQTETTNSSITEGSSVLGDFTLTPSGTTSTQQSIDLNTTDTADLAKTLQAALGSNYLVSYNTAPSTGSSDSSSSSSPAPGTLSIGISQAGIAAGITGFTVAESTTQAASVVSAPTGGVDIYTSDGTATGSDNYNVTVGTLSDASVGTSDINSALGTQITATVGGVTGNGGVAAGGSAGTSLTGTDLNSQADAEAALQTVDNAISAVAYQRGQVGANINTLNAASNIASSQETNVTSAQNTITATDYTSATSNLSKYEILTQTGISALAQANSTEQMVTKLLQ